MVTLKNRGLNPCSNGMTIEFNKSTRFYTVHLS